MNDVNTNHITGYNEEGQLTELEIPINNFYKAFNSKNFELMKQVWANNDYISMENPAGGMRFGWKDIENVYKKVLANSLNIKAEFFNYHLYKNQATYWAVGYEKVTLGLSNEEKTLYVRITRIFEKHNQLWKLVHLHGSFENANDLQFYQKITNSN
ncbi:nuclear transport factor 2 family protein [Leuconostoc pseudomesenteroides]|uniref:nuclear transport factor 2 family protein n=1 Tax=Leuconostoc pseudomesenteroides TaxID=33968 RepID=UPI00403DC8D7